MINGGFAPETANIIKTDRFYSLFREFHTPFKKDKTFFSFAGQGNSANCPKKAHLSAGKNYIFFLS